MMLSNSPFRLLLALLGFTLPLGLASTTHAEEDPGQAVFLEQECNGCHTIKALGIEITEVEDDEAEEEDDDRESPDLSGVGNEHDKKWIAKYMIKREEIEDKKHPRRFRGSKQELAAVATWLESLKQSDGDAAEAGPGE